MTNTKRRSSKSNRRGRGEGSIYQRKDGRWVTAVTLPRDPVTGARRRKPIYGATRAAVSSQLATLLGKVESGEAFVLSAATITVEKCCNDWYAATAPKKAWALKTRAQYRYAIDSWIVPGLGAMRLQKLEPLHVQAWADGLGARKRTQQALSILKQAINRARRLKLVAFNHVDCVDKPPVPKRKPFTTFTADDVRALQRVEDAHRLGRMVVVAVARALRVSETCGLSWDDFDAHARTLKLRQQVTYVSATMATKIGVQGGLQLTSTLKTDGSHETLTVPPFIVDVFERQRKAQLRERLRAGDTWANPHRLMFTTETGGILDQDRARTGLSVLLRAADLPNSRHFHRLRHTAATLMLEKLKDPVAVQRMMRHQRLATTTDTYGHATAAIAAATSDEMQSLFGDTHAAAATKR